MLLSSPSNRFCTSWKNVLTSKNVSFLSSLDWSQKFPGRALLPFSISTHKMRKANLRSMVARAGRDAGYSESNDESHEPAEKELQADESASMEGMGDWREFRAKLVQGSRDPSSLRESAQGNGDESQEGSGTFSWAHPLVKPETGCLIIAHPSEFGSSQQYFHQAVIFLMWHTEEGSSGVILNRPTEYTLDQVAGFEKLMPEFSGARLYLGGDVGTRTTYVLHAQSDLEESKEIISGVYVGGYSSIMDHVRSGKSEAKEYRWFARYAGWGPGQLEREVAAGVWLLGSCSTDLITRNDDGSTQNLWREVLELMGGEYKEIAKKGLGGQ